MSHLAFDLIAWPETKEVYPLIQGKGKEGLLLIINSSVESRQEDADYLEKIGKAVGLEPLAEKVFRIVTENPVPFSLSQLCREKRIDKIIFFGYPPAQAGIRAEWPAYQWMRMAGKAFLQVDSLQQIRTERAAGNSQKAKALWAALQQIN